MNGKMGDKLTSAQILMRQIIEDIAFNKCIADRGFETPFAIRLTDSTDYEVIGAFVADKESRRIRLHSLDLPNDGNGNLIERDMIFPIRVAARDHTGRTFEDEVRLMH